MLLSNLRRVNSTASDNFFRKPNRGLGTCRLEQGFALRWPSSIALGRRAALCARRDGDIFGDEDIAATGRRSLSGLIKSGGFAGERDWRSPAFQIKGVGSGKVPVGTWPGHRRQKKILPELLRRQHLMNLCQSESAAQASPHVEDPNRDLFTAASGRGEYISVMNKLRNGFVGHTSTPPHRHRPLLTGATGIPEEIRILQ